MWILWRWWSAAIDECDFGGAHVGRLRRELIPGETAARPPAKSGGSHWKAKLCVRPGKFSRSGAIMRSWMATLSGNGPRALSWARGGSPCAMRYNAGMRALHVGISQVFSLHHLHERESRRGAAEHATRDAPRAAVESPEKQRQGSVQQSSIKGIVHSKVQGSVQGKVQAVSKAADLAVNTAAMYKSV